MNPEISIHALRGEGDRTFCLMFLLLYLLFQSTPSAGRATIIGSVRSDGKEISIHALRGEGDLDCSHIWCSPPHISIHALRGEGDYTIFALYWALVISIHALRGEGDTTSLKSNPWKKK